MADFFADIPAPDDEKPRETGFFDDIAPAKPSGWSSHLPRAIADIPAEIGNAASENIDAIKQGFTNKAEQGVIGGQIATGKGLLGIAGLAMSPLTGAARSLIGHPLADTEQAIGSLINPEVAARNNPQEVYERAKGGVDLAMEGLRPKGSFSAVRTPGARSIAYDPTGGMTPPTPPPTGPLGVVLTEGQATRNLPAIQREQAALRGTSGPAAQGRAQQFADQQGAQVAAAREQVSEGLDPFGQRIAADPQQAAEIAQNSIQRTAGQRRADVDAAYDRARSLPGEVSVDAFRDIGPRIKTELSRGPEPIIIDDRMTPHASRAIQDIDNEIANLRIQNRADPNTDLHGQPTMPPGATISGISLRGIDQMRRRLSTFRRDAFGSGNSTDGRAAQAVVRAFDEQIDHAINNGMFTGDPRAIQAWNTARAAHADFRGTFSAQTGDPVGRVVERIIGNRNNPAAIPNDVADFIYGSSGVNPNSLNVAVAHRVRSILGDRSPEWSGVKQGLFSRLVETPEGVTDMGPGRVAQRINQFLNGSGRELAQTMFTPSEVALIRQYADLNRALEVPQAGANWSNSATFLAPMLRGLSGRIGSLLHATIGHTIGRIPVVGRVGAAMLDSAGGAVSNMQNMRQISRQMPLLVEATQRFQRALAAYNRANTPPSSIALGAATSNMARAFRQVGVELSMPGTGRADEQQDVPRPPGQ